MSCEGQPQSLTAEDVEKALTNLGTSADGTSFVYLDLCLSRRSLGDVRAIAKFKHVQALDISKNRITDLSALGALSHLCTLDTSHNYLERLLDFTPPLNLIEANCSHNRLTSFDGVQNHRYLQRLYVSHNEIGALGNGLRSLACLKVLVCNTNKITAIESVDKLPLRHLDLSNNQIGFLESVDGLDTLQELLLGGNSISSLQTAKALVSLQRLEMPSNLLVDIEQVEWLAELPLLTHLNLKHNAVQDAAMYRMRVIHRLPTLLMLDGTEVVPEEKVRAFNFHNPPTRQTSATQFLPDSTASSFTKSPTPFSNAGGTVYAA